MQPGPTIIRECSACGKHLAQGTLQSGNTFGARYWTDGKREAPMLPDRPALVRCPHCGALVWIDEQREVGEVPPWGASEHAEFSDALPVATPSLQEYASFLEAGAPTSQQARYVRFRIWHAGNDPRRRPGHATPLAPVETQNLLALVDSLDESQAGDRLTKAEALRELGEFAGAETLLAFDFGADYSHAVERIQELVRQRNSTVAEILLDAPRRRGASIR